MTLYNQPPKPDDRALILFLLVMLLILLGAMCSCTSSRALTNTSTRTDSHTYQTSDSCAISCTTSATSLHTYDTTYYRVVIYDTTRHDVHLPYMTIAYGHAAGTAETTIIRDTVRVYQRDTVIMTSDREEIQQTRTIKRISNVERYLIILTLVFAASGFATLFARIKKGLS